MVDQRNLGNSIKDTYVFDLEMSDQGRRINDLAESLNLQENREKFKADSDAFMDEFQLTEAEKYLIIGNDWLNLVKAGGNIYNVIRIAALFDIGLYPMGAQQLGLAYEDFLKTRSVRGAT